MLLRAYIFVKNLNLKKSKGNSKTKYNYLSCKYLLQITQKGFCSIQPMNYLILLKKYIYAHSSIYTNYVSILKYLTGGSYVYLNFKVYTN